MALIVTSGVGKVHRIRCTQDTAKIVIPQLIDESRSFYYEPLPYDYCEVVVDHEHAHRVLRLVQEST